MATKATAKKKPTAAQLAARKLFAARAKAGVFKGVTAPKRTAGYTKIEQAEAEMRIAKKHAARKKNPAPVKRKTNPVKARITLKPAYHIPGDPVVLVDSRRTAEEIAEVLATYYKTPFQMILP